MIALETIRKLKGEKCNRCGFRNCLQVDHIHPREIFSALRLLGYRWHVIKTGLFFLPINLSESNFKLKIRRLY